MSTNRLLCLAQALTLISIGALTCYGVCVASTEAEAHLTDILLAVLIATVFACTCLVAAMLNANRQGIVEEVLAGLRDEGKFSEAAAARALVAYAEGADGPDAEVINGDFTGRR